MGADSWKAKFDNYSLSQLRNKRFFGLSTFLAFKIKNIHLHKFQPPSMSKKLCQRRLGGLARCAHMEWLVLLVRGVWFCSWRTQFNSSIGIWNPCILCSSMRTNKWLLDHPKRNFFSCTWHDIQLKNFSTFQIFMKNLTLNQLNEKQ